MMAVVGLINVSAVKHTGSQQTGWRVVAVKALRADAGFAPHRQGAF
jgi:hypothetical protein